VLDKVVHPLVATSSMKRAKIILVFAPKGGVGKTMIATNLLVAAWKAGLSVAGLDLDGQRAFAAWGRDRADHHAIDQDSKFVVKAGHIEDWRAEMHSVRGRELIVVDTPPGVERRNQVALQELGAAADVILMPTEVYGGSLRYVVDFMTWWETKPGRALFVLNKTIAGRSLVREARELLKGRGEVWEDSIPLRDDLARAFDCGLAATDDEQIPGYPNFVALWTICANRLGIAA
jgi:cellulose biosynthesis protein BcsQ